MNDRDRGRLARLYEAIADWPNPNRNRTIGIGDLSEFMNNMTELQPILLRSVMAISRCDVEYPDDELDELEDTIRRMRHE